MNNPITIRSATLSDLPTLLRFEQGIVRAERPLDPTLKPGEIHYYDLPSLIRSESTEVAVACMDNKAIGSGFLEIREAQPYRLPAKFGYVGFMFVEPEFRGQGVSQSVLEHLIAWAQGHGIHEIRLEVYDTNGSAVRAYEKAGFEKSLVTMRLGLEN